MSHALTSGALEMHSHHLCFCHTPSSLLCPPFKQSMSICGQYNQLISGYAYVPPPPWKNNTGVLTRIPRNLPHLRSPGRSPAISSALSTLSPLLWENRALGCTHSLFAHPLLGIPVLLCNSVVPPVGRSDMGPSTLGLTWH